MVVHHICPFQSLIAQHGKPTISFIHACLQDDAALEGTRQLQAELRSARAAASEAADAAKVAQAEAQRLRKTLINAEMELQQASVTNDDLRQQLQVTILLYSCWSKKISGPGTLKHHEMIWQAIWHKRRLLGI